MDGIQSLKLNLHDFISVPYIPPPPEDSDTQARVNCNYNSNTLTAFSNFINNFYESSRFWRNNIFLLPPGKASKKFIELQAYWLDQFNYDTPWKSIALTTVLVLPNLLLQKPSGSSKTADHRKLLEERLECWESGKLDELIKDGLTIQRKLLQSSRKQPSVSQLFVRHMLNGKLNAATRLLETEGSGGILPLSNTVIETLKEKHPPAAPATKNSLLHGPVEEVPPSYFDDINEQKIARAIRTTKGAAGPSNISGEFIQHYCHKKFSVAGQSFREALARLARKLATKQVHPKDLASWTACKLIPLDKQPGVRPIGVGEILRRVVGKVVSWAVKKDVMAAAGPLQVAAGLKSGAEGAIHAMRELFDEDTAEAMILIDASNAFNRMNRSVALHNTRILCPEVATYLINTYRVPSSLLIRGEKNTGEVIWSYEGTVQGDNLGMHFYCLATVPIIQTLHHHLEPPVPPNQTVAPKSDLKQCWLADDASAVGTFRSIRKWFDKLMEIGYQYGYFVNQSKTWLIVKKVEDFRIAHEIFQGTDVQITLEGKRHLGACIGSKGYRREYCNDLVKKWCAEVERLCEVAKYHPHAAYANYIHSYQHKYTYFLRTLPGFEEYLKPLDELITYGLLPTLFGSPLTQVERRLVALPTRHGGLGITILAEKAADEYKASIAVTNRLVNAIKDQNQIFVESDGESITNLKLSKEAKHRAKLDELKNEVTPAVRRVLEVISEKGASSWLNALPLEKQGFALNKTEFTDAINLRYFRELRGLPTNCPCGHPFNITHALNCKKGGFIHIRHDSIRDLLGNVLARVQTDVEIEPHLLPTAEDTQVGNTADGARLDIRARGFWRAGQNAFFDVRVFNPISATSLKSTLVNSYNAQEREKKRAYNRRVMETEGGTFTPLVFSCFGTPSKECSKFLKLLTDKLNIKNKDQISDSMCWLRCKLSFLCIKNLVMCMRGSRTIRKLYVSDDFKSDVIEAGF